MNKSHTDYEGNEIHDAVYECNDMNLDLEQYIISQVEKPRKALSIKDQERVDRLHSFFMKQDIRFSRLMRQGLKTFERTASGVLIETEKALIFVGPEGIYHLKENGYTSYAYGYERKRPSKLTEEFEGARRVLEYLAKGDKAAAPFYEKLYTYIQYAYDFRKKVNLNPPKAEKGYARTEW